MYYIPTVWNFLLPGRMYSTVRYCPMVEYDVYHFDISFDRVCAFPTPQLSVDPVHETFAWSPARLLGIGDDPQAVFLYKCSSYRNMVVH
jgi:hypothetical protein